MRCSKCNGQVPPSARFCGTCGQFVESEPALAAAIPIGAGDASTAWSAASAATPGALNRIKGILLSPKTEWRVIESETTTVGQLFIGYAMPLTALAALASFVRMSLIGINLPFQGVIRTPIAGGLMTAVATLLFGLIGVFIVGLIINGLASTFGGTRDQRQALKVAAYSFTPAWLSAVLAMSPILSTLLQLMAGLYGIYLLYQGLPIVMRSPRERALGYTATVVICTILLGIAFGIVGGALGYLGHSTRLVGSSLAEQAAAQDRAAAETGNIIGGALGTDSKGKADLTAALSNLAKSADSDTMPPATATSSTPARGTHDNAASPLSAVGGLMTALGGALGGDHPVQTVDFKTLTALLPNSLPDMKRTDARGQSQAAAGVTTSSATGIYQGNNGTGIQIEITDVSGVAGLMGIAGALVQDTASASDSGFERNRTIDGRSVHEKYDGPARHGELTVLLAKRYQVDMTGDRVDMDALEKALNQIDLARLESMKGQGSPAK